MAWSLIDIIWFYIYLSLHYNCPNFFSAETDLLFRWCRNVGKNAENFSMPNRNLKLCDIPTIDIIDFMFVTSHLLKSDLFTSKRIYLIPMCIEHSTSVLTNTFSRHLGSFGKFIDESCHFCSKISLGDKKIWGYCLWHTSLKSMHEIPDILAPN